MGDEGLTLRERTWQQVVDPHRLFRLRLVHVSMVHKLKKRLHTIVVT